MSHSRVAIFYTGSLIRVYNESQHIGSWLICTHDSFICMCISMYNESQHIGSWLICTHDSFICMYISTYNESQHIGSWLICTHDSFISVYISVHTERQHIITVCTLMYTDMNESRTNVLTTHYNASQHIHTCVITCLAAFEPATRRPDDE